MNILITAIGSMSAECAITQLKSLGHYIVGVDIYPANWHYQSTLCDCFYQAPLAINETEYINFLLKCCHHNNISHIIPLTDIEIDVLNRHRQHFNEHKVTLCMQSEKVLSIVRNKYRLFSEFRHDSNVPSIKTFLLSDADINIQYPCVAKPINGRSSEGLIRNAYPEHLNTIKNKNEYMIQEQLSGNIFTVDYCRCESTNNTCIIPREELIRTSNGAGLTIKITNNPILIALVSHIGRHLNINGCVNMEFINHNGNFYLIDINPRFSAGISFSLIAGYDMIVNHLNCFTNKNIDNQISINQQIITKKYQDVILS